MRIGHGPTANTSETYYQKLSSLHYNFWTVQNLSIFYDNKQYLPDTGSDSQRTV